MRDYGTMFGIDVRDSTAASDEALGGYIIVAQTAARSANISLDSDDLGDVDQGSYVNVTEVRYVAADDRVRARLSDGSWISVLNTDTGRRWATPNRMQDQLF